MESVTETTKKTKAFTKALTGVKGGLEMLEESKAENLSALSQIGIILMDNKVREKYGLENGECEIQKFLSNIHFLLANLNTEAVKSISEHINLEFEKVESE